MKSLIKTLSTVFGPILTNHFGPTLFATSESNLGPETV
jgi:hypothetical protein